MRTAGGWRAYGSAQIARVHMIIVVRPEGRRAGVNTPAPRPGVQSGIIEHPWRCTSASGKCDGFFFQRDFDDNHL